MARQSNRSYPYLIRLKTDGIDARITLNCRRQRAQAAASIVHLNERDNQVRAASEGHTPCVLAHTDNGLIRLLGPVELDAADGDVERFATALRAAAARAGSRWPSRSQ